MFFVFILFFAQFFAFSLLRRQKRFYARKTTRCAAAAAVAAASDGRIRFPAARYEIRRSAAFRQARNSRTQLDFLIVTVVGAAGMTHRAEYCDATAIISFDFALIPNQTGNGVLSSHLNLESGLASHCLRRYRYKYIRESGYRETR